VRRLHLDTKRTTPKHKTGEIFHPVFLLRQSTSEQLSCNVGRPELEKGNEGGSRRAGDNTKYNPPNNVNVGKIKG